MLEEKIIEQRKEKIQSMAEEKLLEEQMLELEIQRLRNEEEHERQRVQELEDNFQKYNQYIEDVLNGPPAKRAITKDQP